MKKYLLILLTLLLLPFTIKALEYKDVVAPISGIEENKELTIYLFHGAECPHCAAEIRFLNELEEEYQDKLKIVKYEVWHNEDNEKILNQVKTYFNVNTTGVPFTVIGEKYVNGYSENVGSDLEIRNIIF